MPDGTISGALQRAAASHEGHLVHAGRRDRSTARIIYQAQALRRAFGRRAAHTFLIAKRVPAELVLRVLSVPDQQLRR